ncbi:MAG: hypothetical protein KAT54_05995 [Candidatus Marinimicrobia bacterium]|nr:hypothetical protein [Candidatus Neomarinimicrobiota bacterium]
MPIVYISLLKYSNLFHRFHDKKRNKIPDVCRAIYVMLVQSRPFGTTHGLKERRALVVKK